MKRYYCTYFDINYLHKGIALIKSLEMHEHNDYTFLIICMDQFTQTFLSTFAFSSVELIPFSTIEKNDKELLNTKQTRSPVEYIWTAKSSILNWLLNEKPEIEAICYIDADIFFFQKPDVIWEKLNTSSVLIHEHKFSKEQSELLKYGKYNAGFVCFVNDQKGQKVLNWWRERSIEWCYDCVENNKFADQFYLQTFPTFDGVGVVQHIGVGVAPWNHTQYNYLTKADGQVLVNDTPLIFYHFHSLITVEAGHIILSSNQDTLFSKEVIQSCYIPYLDCLYETFQTIYSIQADFPYGIVGKDMISNDHTFLAHKSICKRVKSFNPPHQCISLNENWECFAIKPFYSTVSDKLAPKTVETINLPTNKERIDPDLLLNQAEQELSEDNTASAIKTLVKIVENIPDYYLAYNDLGVIHWKSGYKNQAVQYLKKAYELNPFDAKIVMNFGKMLINLKDIQSAINIFSHYLKRFPEDQTIRTLLNNHAHL
jgi:hypothetical protein